MHLTIENWGALGLNGSASAAAASAASSAAPGGLKADRTLKEVDPRTGKLVPVGEDVAVYDETTLLPGDVFGVESLALIDDDASHTAEEDGGQLPHERPPPSDVPPGTWSHDLPRAHTATTAEHSWLLFLPQAMLFSEAPRDVRSRAASHARRSTPPAHSAATDGAPLPARTLRVLPAHR